MKSDDLDEEDDTDRDSDDDVGLANKVEEVTSRVDDIIDEEDALNRKSEHSHDKINITL